MWSDLRIRLRALFQRKSVETEMDDELRFHFERRVESLEQSGLSPEEATRRARLKFGGADSVKEECREARGISFLDTTWQDIRYGVRMLRKNPGFTATAIVTLALGIGASTAMFSVIENVLINPFPYKDGNTILQLRVRDLSNPNANGARMFPGPEFLDYEQQNDVFQEVIGGGMEGVIWSSKDGNQALFGSFVTPNEFDFLGVPAMMGRTLTPNDSKPGAPPVFILSYYGWTKFFGQDPSIVGQSFVLDNVPTTLVGIMPPRVGKQRADLWYPAAMDRADEQFSQRYFQFQGRLKPGVTVAQAQAAMDALAHRLAQTYPKNYPQQFRAELVPWINNAIGQFRATLLVLCAAVGLLLLIACSNVANMLLAKSTSREKEMAVRGALGATRWRIVRQLLVETLMLSLGGALVGCLFAYEGIKGIVAAIPEGTIPRESVIHLSVPVLLFALGLAVVTAVLFGLAPAMQAAKRDLVEPLKDSGRGSSSGFRKGKLRNALIIVEVALSIVLLVGAGVMMHTFVNLTTVDLGFKPDNLLFARLPFPNGQYTKGLQKQQFFTQLLGRLSALPGVVAASEISNAPPDGGINSTFDIPGKVHSDDWRSIVQLSSEDYFRTIGVQLLRGRLFSQVDVNSARKVAVVNQTLAAKYFGQEDPIGQEIKLNGLTHPPGLDPVADPTFEIIGVVSDAKNQGITDVTLPETVIPYTVTGAFNRGILVRTSRDPENMLSSLQREIWAVDRNVATANPTTLTGYLQQNYYSGPRFTLILLGIFAGVGLVLVSLGVYSVTAYTVSQQTHEFGIRMALGAGRGDVLRMVMWVKLRLIASGAVVGLIISLGVTRVIENQLWHVSSHDPLTLACVVGVLLLVGCAACYFPARRAMRVDPMKALRYE